MKDLPIYYEGNHIYDIVYHDSFDGLKNCFEQFDAGKKKLCIVSDSNVAANYLEEVKRVAEESFITVSSYVFDAGEESKNLDTVKKIYTKLIEDHFTRNDMLLALGGGVTGDMCGYAAATYLRGVDFIQVPTSLLADVDSSIGGKTGVDFDQYKNMVGAFHMPKLVYINLATLNTLDKRQFWSGMGEVVKSALIKDGAFYSWLKDNIKILSKEASNADSADTFSELNSHMVHSCNVIKKNVVEEDPHETKGERELLNFGHTLGHALEKYMNFSLLHGECVSIGCIFAAIISRNKGLISAEDCSDIVTFISDNFCLPKISLKDEDIYEIIKLTHSDKKAVGNTIKFVLLDSIGNAIIRRDVTDDDMYKAVTEYLNK